MVERLPSKQDTRVRFPSPALVWVVVCGWWVAGPALPSWAAAKAIEVLGSAAVAQLVEHLIGNEEVHSSILCGSTSPQPDYARLFPAPVERRFFRAFLLLRFRQGDGFGSLAHQQARDEGQQRCDQKKADQMVRADEGRV